MRQILQRLEAFDLKYNHPFLLAALLSELERGRLMELFERVLDRCKLRIDFRESGPDGSPLVDLSQVEMTSHLGLCLESRELMNQMKISKRPLASIIEENSKLEGSLQQSFHDERYRSKIPISEVISSGKRMSLRLEEISCEYDDKIYECNMILDNMALAMQMVRVLCLNLRRARLSN